MLPKINRLTKKKDFEIVFKEGESAKQGFLIVKSKKSDLKESRFGFVVSKKISAKATVRNKVRRRLRAAVAKTLPALKKITDVVVITLPGIEKKEFVDIVALVTDSFKKLKLL